MTSRKKCLLKQTTKSYFQNESLRTDCRKICLVIEYSNSIFLETSIKVLVSLMFGKKRRLLRNLNLHSSHVLTAPVVMHQWEYSSSPGL